MFERFDQPARQVVVRAQEEARRLRHDYIGTEHLLLGLLADAAAGRALCELGVTSKHVRGEVAKIIGWGSTESSGQIPFTPRAKKVLELGLREALVLSSNHIGPEHLFLGLVRENGGVASRILFDCGVTPRRVADSVLAALPDVPRGHADAFSDGPPEASSRGVTALPSMATLGRFRETSPLPAVIAALIAAVAVGILIGWLIWG
jgi:ATP-dependent Clp protease ATP-binding subunit ClpC